MNKIYYPAIFHPEKTGYSVSVPDIDGCFSEGDTLEEAIEMITGAITLCLEDYDGTIPKASLPSDIPHEDGDFVRLMPYTR